MGCADAWILTGGTDTGVMALVGQAMSDPRHMADEASAAPARLIGIAPWGVVRHRKRLHSKARRMLLERHFEMREHEEEAIRLQDEADAAAACSAAAAGGTSSRDSARRRVRLRSRSRRHRGSDEEERVRAHEDNEVWTIKYRASSANHDSNDPSVALEPNHSHFLLVDDGTVEQFYGEVDFRS